ncbi:carbohydrate porin [Pacificimonas sp. WHA3]|uniref:Carbohydrate porin n=2 Tax=Pacificimonas pallii TaxID=2827236 RepID=A0ABS6SA98_9SPHN|nr:carbohydrate porin [Pacificimonas pallii]
MTAITAPAAWGREQAQEEDISVQPEARDDVAAHPVQVEFSYTADVWYNFGGARDGSRYLDNVDVTFDVDFEQAFGWEGMRGFLYVLYNNGKSLSELTGDAMVVSNIETGVRALRLYEAWVERDISATANIRVGLYDLNSEFDALEHADIFMGSAHGVGMDIAQTGENGPSIFPVTSLAARLSIDVGDDLTIRMAALDAIPGDPSHPARTAIKINDGALVIGEADWTPGPVRILAGAWRYTLEFERLGQPGDGRSQGVYIRGETCLLQSEDCTLGVFARAGMASGRVNPFDVFLSAGATYRHGDDLKFGIAAAHARASKGARLQSTSAGSETVFETTIAHQLSDWISIQPNVQWVLNPGANDDFKDAVVVGMRVGVSY